MFGRAVAEFLQAVLDIESDIDQHTVGIRLDLVFAEEDVGLEVGQGLVYDIWIWAVFGKTWCWSSDRALDWQDCYIAYSLDTSKVTARVVGWHCSSF